MGQELIYIIGIITEWLVFFMKSEAWRTKLLTWHPTAAVETPGSLSSLTLVSAWLHADVKVSKQSLIFLARSAENCSHIDQLPLRFILRTVHINGDSDYTLISESIPLMNKDDLGLVPAAERLKGNTTFSEIKDTGQSVTHFASSCLEKQILSEAMGWFQWEFSRNRYERRGREGECCQLEYKPVPL